MERPTPARSLMGAMLLAIGASGYLWPMLTHAGAAKVTVAKAETQTRAFRSYHDRQVTVDLPDGWRWLAQKRDGAEDQSNYFALSRFQGQNVLKEPVSVRIDAFNNPKSLKASALLALFGKGQVSGTDGAVKPIKAVPPGTAGMTYATKERGRPVGIYLYVKPAGDLAYVVSIGAYDERFTENLANRIFTSLKVDR